MVEIRCSVCKYNKFGFCRYCDKCKRIHYKEQCQVRAYCMDINRCTKRYPKARKVFALESFFRFGTCCPYHHAANPILGEYTGRSKIMKDLENSCQRNGSKD